MARSIWKGAISFGLVHVPVSMYTASQEEEIDFDWLDKRTMDPVGYQRINKRTGKAIDKDDIVKGVKTESGEYVVLSDDEIRAAFPKRTQTIEIQSFVKADEVSFVYIEKPYYLEPDNRADKVYALLREAMADASLIGVATIVMHNKEHLAALLPAGPALMLGTLRWANEVRPATELDLPAQGADANRIKPAELKMARQLISEMTGPFKPQEFSDTFSDAIRELVAKRAKAGKTETVEPMEEAPKFESNVVDLTDLLRESLKGRGGARKAPAANSSESEAKPARKAAARQAAPAKAARKRA